MVINSAKQQATFLFTQILQEKDFLNTQLINKIEVLHGQSDSAFTAEFWKNLIADPHSNDISVEEMNGIIEPELPKIMEEQKNREQVISETAAKSQEVPAA